MMTDLTGQRFGRLVAVKPLRRRYTTGAVMWKCVCDCGRYTTVPSTSLRSLHSKSCGCWHRDAARRQIDKNRPEHPGWKHGGTSKFSDPALARAYRIYRAVICRCYNPRARSFRFYGAVGVQVCTRWLGEFGFENFVADCGLPRLGESISRWMDCGDYSPQNARFATAKEQRAEKAKKRRFIQQTLRAELRIGPYGLSKRS